MRKRREGRPARGMAFLTALLMAFLMISGGAEAIYGIGSKGQEIKEIKIRLQELRYIERGNLTGKYTENTAESVREFQKRNGLEATGTVDGQTWEKLFSQEAVPMPRATMIPLRPEATPTPPEIPQADADGFLTGAGEEYIYEDDENGLWIYLSASLQVRISRKKDASIPLVWFETEIRTREGEAFRTAMTDWDRPGQKFQYPYIISREEKYVLGFSDDFFAERMSKGYTVGIIIRDGRIISDMTNRDQGYHLPNLDMMAQYPDGRLEVYACNERTAEEMLADGAVNVFSFGPILLRAGEINEGLYTHWRDTEPRHALGMIEPGHYLLISIQGRTKESKGAPLQRVAEMMRDAGVQQALNLDGGNTMALVFRGRMLNKLATYKRKQFVRTVTSLIGIGTTQRQEE